MYTKLLLLIFLSFANGQYEDGKDICGIINVHCICDTKENPYELLLRIEKYVVKDPDTGKMACLGVKDPHDVCANYTCEFKAIDPYEQYLLEESAENTKNSLISSLYPKEFHVPRRASRSPRNNDTCQVPTLKHADVKCWMWPNWMSCKILCLHGYAHEGPNRSEKTTIVNCRRGEDVWKPNGFPDCKPFLNCKVQLVKPGHVMCTEDLLAPTYCAISCFDYEKYRESARKKYRCIDGKYIPNLPHCAALDDGVQLIKKPTPQ